MKSKQARPKRREIFGRMSIFLIPFFLTTVIYRMHRVCSIHGWILPKTLVFFHVGGVVLAMPQIDDTVRLTSDLPDLWLRRGMLGVIRSVWFAPNAVYEVEFEPTGLNCPTRALLLDEQIVPTAVGSRLANLAH